MRRLLWSGRGAVVIAAMIVCIGCTFSPRHSTDGPAPRIMEERIAFLGGKVLPYTRFNRLAPTPIPPEFADRVIEIREQAVLISEWKRVAMIREETLYEGAAIRLVVYDYHGHPRGVPHVVASRSGWSDDSVFLLRSARRIFLGQSSGHVTVNTSYLLDENGYVIREISQPSGMAAFARSDDERIIWIIAAATDSTDGTGKLAATVTAIDSRDGHEIRALKAEQGQEVSVLHEGKRYAISVRVPDS